MLKGEEAEEKVHDLLLTLDRNYRVISKIIITSENDSSQIDHVIVSMFGVFVIETKSNSGTIVGDTFSSTWTQILRSTKLRFQNPVRQNYSHIKAIQSLFPERPEDQFIPIVVFVGDADLDVSHKANPVVKLNKLIPVIKALSVPRIDQDDVDYIYKRINYFKVKNKDQLESHIEFIRNKLSKRRQEAYKGICPVCGKFLTIQIDEHGHFLGCSRYPDCDFIVTSN